MTTGIAKWENDFNTGHAKIDEQHQQVFSYINQLHLALKKKDEAEIIQILNGLLEYSVYHFKLEEEEMKELNYPRYEAHKEEHQIFTERLLKLTSDMQRKNKSINLRLLKFLKVWFSGHILNTDKKFVNFQNGKE